MSNLQAIATCSSITSSDWLNAHDIRMEYNGANGATANVTATVLRAARSALRNSQEEPSQTDERDTGTDDNFTARICAAALMVSVRQSMVFEW
jgi:hypothetical protein